MAAPTFIERRRAARPSHETRIAILGSLLFCFTLVWFCVFDMHGKATFDEFASSTNYLDNWDGETGPAVTIAPEHPSIPLRLITYNVRFDNSRPVKGEKRWHIRGPKLVNQMKFIASGHENSFFCLQECLYHQVDDIQKRLGDSWASIGRGRGQNETDEEYSPIFYRPDVWECTKNETKWLSPTPDVPSKGWDAALPRIVTVGEFTHVETGVKVVVMATHFDHMGHKARENSAKFLINLSNTWAEKTDPAAVLVGGDFNSDAKDGAYQMMIAPDSGMSDISHLLPAKSHYGNTLTYTSFGEGYDASTIDFLFIHEPRKAEILTYGVLPNIFDDKIRLSDHRPVVSDMLIPV